MKAKELGPGHVVKLADDIYEVTAAFVETNGKIHLTIIPLAEEWNIILPPEQEVQVLD